MLILLTLLTAAAAERAPAAVPESAAVATPAIAAGDALAPGFELAPSQAAAAPAEGKWTGSVGFTASLSSGNTEKTTLGASAQAERKGEKDRWFGQLLWNYSDEDGIGVTQRRTYGQVKYDYFLSEKMYAFGVVSGENDFTAALDLRLTAGGGIGKQFRDDEEWKISGEAGLSYVDENYDGSADDTDYIAARLAYKVDTTMSKDWTAGQWGEVFPSIESSDDVSARIDTHARFSFSEKMFAQVQHIYSWDNTPATGAERVDNLLLLALGWSF